MIDLTEAARRLNADPLLAPSPMSELRRRVGLVRRRRNRIAAITVSGTVAVVCAAVAILIVVAPSGNHRVVVQTGPTTTPTVTSPPLSPVPPPPLLYVHLRQVGNGPGPIEEIDTHTGHVVRTVGADYDPYVQDGFNAGPGNTVYWTHLDEPHQTFPITQLTDNQNTRTVGYGTTDLPSPNGRWLFVTGNRQDPLQLLVLQPDNPADHHQAGIATQSLPEPASTDEGVTSFAWLPDSSALVTITVASPPDCPSSPADTRVCTTTAPLPAPQAWILYPSSPASGWHRLPAPTGGWQNTALFGPGRLPGTILAVSDTTAPGTTAFAAETINVLSGTIIDHVPLPGTVTAVLASDHTGTNLLVAFTGYTNLARLSLASPQPIPIITGVAEATWW
jgi:hypothetical protein